ncbi:MAG TPA: xanthine dehydrogenase family protein molybdopterin-binding subunit [Burkholderiales bacterium]|nr:xanthine dehydrogenase family protein molybdopterin-binding subunit [Burkholderiales bacterium]
MITNESRRDFLKASGALLLGVHLPQALAQSPVKYFEPNAFVRIGADNTVTVIVKHLEMGQGTYTGLPTLVAEELDADWPQMRAIGAPADAKRYNNTFWGEVQGTGGSTALPNSYEQMRKAGATARAMLVAAAAEKWNAPANEIKISHGTLYWRDRRATFGQLAADAAKQKVPENVTLKDPKDFIYIGKPARRIDARAKSDGTALFTQDVKLPGMLTAVVLHPPRFGAKLKSFDAAKAKAIKGVREVVAFSTATTDGVAVLAADYWTAKKGRDALTAEWDDSNAFRLSSAELMDQYKKLAATAGASARKEGDADAAMKNAARTLEAAYEFPFLAHAAMEPMNCVARLDAGGCEMWNGEQFQTVDQVQVAKQLGLRPDQVKLNQLYAGGSFGRRANPKSDFLLEAAAIAKAIEGRAPVKLVWGREDDMKAGWYRPMYYHTLKAGLDAQGNIIAWKHVIVGQSILTGTAFEPMMVKDGVDATSVEGASNLPYAIPNLAVELHSPKIAVPVQWWRSVGSTHTAFATECFLDEIAREAKKDPFELRRALLAKHPRHKGVLEAAAQKAGWGKPLPKGRARGIAVHESFNTFVAQVVEISGRKIERVVCAVDCGVPVNPNIIAMQMESGIGFGLSAALAGAITLKEGVVEQSNFHDYPVVRMNQMPPIEVVIVPSQEKPSGVGEPGTPLIAPALANALLALNGKAVRTLPLGQQARFV